jgi:hypothetical protein
MASSSPATNATVPGVDIVATTPAHVVCVFENVVIHRLMQATSLDYLAHAAEGRLRALATRRGGFAVVVLVEPSAPLPDSSVRREASRLWKETATDLRAHAIVLGGDGFWAAAVRSAAAAIMTIGDERVPRTVVGSDREGISFVARHLHRSPSFSSDFARVLGDIRAIKA